MGVPPPKIVTCDIYDIFNGLSTHTHSWIVPLLDTGLWPLLKKEALALLVRWPDNLLQGFLIFSVTLSCVDFVSRLLRHSQDSGEMTLTLHPSPDKEVTLKKHTYVLLMLLYIHN